MRITETKLPGVLIIEPRIFRDRRGYFQETFQTERYQDAGLDLAFVQDNHSHSCRHVLRGLHFQRNHPQGKLIYVVQGRVMDVVVDIVRSSPTFGQHVAAELDDVDHRQIYVPQGYAHGFCVVSQTADVIYKCTDYYRPEDEGGLRWNDPQLNIEWPTSDPILSEKDAALPTLAEVNHRHT